MPKEVFSAFLSKLRNYILRHNLPRFNLVFHGGEPMLVGASKFAWFCEKVSELENELGVTLHLAITTNGTLINENWCEVIQKYGVGITVSIDGPKNINDSRRIDRKGFGAFEDTLRGINLLRSYNIDPGFIAVCDPSSSGREVYDFFVNTLNATRFDVLFPDITHDDTSPESVFLFYKDLFSSWKSNYYSQRVDIRILRNMVNGLLNRISHTHSIGGGAVDTIMIKPDGQLAALDVASIIGNNATTTPFNVLNDEIHSIQTDVLWCEIYSASSSLPTPCRGCLFEKPCGGGHIMSRWSSHNGFDNRSVYCSDYKNIFSFIWKEINQSISLQQKDMTDEVACAAGD